MVFIMVGNGSTQCILRVSQVPVVGDTIPVRTSMIKWALTDHAYLMDGSSYKVTNRIGDFDTGRKEFGILPWFSLEIVR